MFYFIIYGIIFIPVIAIFYVLNKQLKNSQMDLFKSGLSQSSFQRYAKFNDEVVPKDDNFDLKMTKIFNEIVFNKKTDIRKIAEKTGCTYEECIFKIKYLKNKNKIGLYHIDHKNGKLIKCSDEELQIIQKYKPYIYYNHLSLEEIATRLPGTNSENVEEVKNNIFNELKILVDNSLLTGIKLNEVDKEILYYSIEKNKKEKDFISIRCDNCGALCDVNRGSKIRCEYCDTIIEDKIEN